MGGGRRSAGYERREDERADRPPAPLFHGEPMWSENRNHTAQENAQYHFERAGNDLGAKTLDEFLTKVHRFCDHPPAGAMQLTRANGDRLIYDPKSNIFAVVTHDGAPRTVFKPNDGMTYWNEQKAREEQASRGGDEEDSGRPRRRAYRSRDEGGEGDRYSDRRSSDRRDSDRRDSDRRDSGSSSESGGG